jgi:Cu(I)/Ag(I) efflux system membrane fusion protein
MNTNQRAVLVAIVALAATGYGMYELGVRQGTRDAAGAVAANAGDPRAVETSPAKDVDPATGRKILYWQDPMVPGQRFDKPGKSPYMDMPLVPVYADAPGAAPGVAIDPRVRQNLGVRTALVEPGALASTLEAVGSVAYNERDVAAVQARANGYLERLYVRAPLDPVRKGQALAEIYVPDWVAVQEEYLAARRIAASGAGDFSALVDGARQRMRLAGMDEGQIRAVEAGARVQPRATIVAPIGGVVGELLAREGMTVMTGTPLFRLNGLSTVWVNAEVPESAAAQVRPGSTVVARAPALPGETFKGKVSAILPEVNPATRTLKARIEFANPGGRLVPGMFATVDFAPPSGRDALLVPTEAVIQTGTRSVVIVARDDGRFEPIDVEIGREQGGKTEIRKGLQGGQRVVTSGQFLIDSEASLRASGTRMGAGGERGAPADANAATKHRGEGVVESVDGNEVMISHGPIPTLRWDAMTMGFRLPSGGLPAGIRVGDRVNFEIRAAADGTFEIASIAPARTPARSARPPAGGAVNDDAHGSPSPHAGGHAAPSAAPATSERKP